MPRVTKRQGSPAERISTVSAIGDPIREQLSFCVFSDMENDAATSPQKFEAQADADQEDIRLAADDFFARMEDFGYFELLEGHLPREFTLVYEIARVFEDENNPLTEKLAPIIHQASGPPKTPPPPPIPILTVGEEYEARPIRSAADIARIYSHEHLLPEEVFDRKIADRSLMMPVAVPPNNFRYQSEANDYAPDSRKQQVYLLLDTSSSMIEHNRIQLAKALCYAFLRANLQELGIVYFRTFDVEIGPLYTADDRHSYSELVHALIGLDSLGNGTAMEKALKTAVADIRAHDNMRDTEILLITDGAVHLDKNALGELFGDTIRLNAVKIGDESIEVNDAYIRDRVLLGDSEQAKLLQKLYKREEEVEAQRRAGANSEQRRSAIVKELEAIQRQKRTVIDSFKQTISSTYGREIEELSEVFINVPDLELANLFTPRDVRINELKNMSAAMLAALGNNATPMAIKQAALHLQQLELFQESFPDETGDLGKTAEDLRAELQSMLNDADGTVELPDIELSEQDEQQLVGLLRKTLGPSSQSLAALLRFLWKRLVKRFKRWRRNRRYRPPAQ